MECVIRPDNAFFLDKLFSVPVTLKISKNIEVMYHTNDEFRKLLLTDTFFEHLVIFSPRIFSIPKTNFFQPKMQFLKLVLTEEVLIFEFNFGASKLTRYLDILKADGVEVPSSSFYYELDLDFQVFESAIELFLYNNHLIIKEKTNFTEREMRAELTNGCNLMIKIDPRALRIIKYYLGFLSNFSFGVGEDEPLNLVFSGDGYVYTFFYAVFTQRI